MKMLYCSFIDEKKRPGYKNKIHSQAKALSKNFESVYLLAINDNNFVLYTIQNEENVEVIPINHKRISNNRNLIDEIIILKKYLNLVNMLVNKLNINFVYIRRIVPITPLLLKNIKNIKKQGAYIAYEYPTYPWKKEMLVTGKTLFLIADLLQYRILKKNINQLVVLGEYRKKDKKVIETMNGIDVGIYPISKKDKKKNKITFIAVGHIMPQHGYDKIINGIASYYKNNKSTTKIFLNIVGTEDARTNLRELTKKLGIEEYVKFWGFKQGKELDKIFNQSDIGVDWLSQNKIHKNKIQGSLKSREYLARGIPFIYAGNLDFVKRLKINKDFIIKVNGDKEEIDINYIINEYEKINTTKSEIREFTKRYLSWNKMMEPVYQKYIKDVIGEQK